MKELPFSLKRPTRGFKVIIEEPEAQSSDLPHVFSILLVNRWDEAQK
jgi:hypothetical protein